MPVDAPVREGKPNRHVYRRKLAIYMILFAADKQLLYLSKRAISNKIPFINQAGVHAYSSSPSLTASTFI